MTKEYDELIEAGTRGLAADEFWCIIDPGGEPMTETASKRFDTPVITFCDALGVEWDDGTEVGYRLGRVTLPDHPAPAAQGE